MRYARAILLSALSVAAARQPFAPGDLWSWRTASDPRIAPTGDWVVFVESWNDRENDERFANLWAVSTDARQRRRLTDGPWRDHSPRWSSGGERVAWISDRSGATQIWLRSQTAGSATFSNISIGQDAGTMGGPAGTFGEQAGSVTINNLVQKTWYTTAGTFTLPNLSLGFGASC